MVKVSALLAFLAISGASAFTVPVPVPAGKHSTTALSMKNENKFTKFLTASVASAIILSSAATTPDALAASPNFDFGTDTIISARSGGRGGGRSSGSSMRSSPRPSARSYSAPSTTINRTTVYSSPSPIISSPIVVSPFGYSPFGGMGYGGYGALGAVNAIGNEMRDNRQENEIARGRAELDVSKQKQAQLEQRLNELERNQVQQK